MAAALLIRALRSEGRQQLKPLLSAPASPLRFYSRVASSSFISSPHLCFSSAAASSPASAFALGSSMDPSRIRNVAVIAHVDHGKTTLMDRLLRQCGADIPHERALDSITLERERGITIASKVTSISWKDNELNMVDTPGHADFGGEVERVVGMVEGAVLVVDAGEGPLAQTKFVLAKALKHGLRPILLLNKVDRPSVSEETCNEVESLVFDLFANLGATEEQLDFPVLYASAKEGWASSTFTKDPAADARNMSPLLDAITSHVPPPSANLEAPFQMLVSMMERDFYLGRILTGRISSGAIHVGDKIQGLRCTDGGVEKIEEGKVTKLMKKKGTSIIMIDSAGAGDIISVAGLTSPSIGHTVANIEVTTALPTVQLDPPTISMTFGVNDSPLAGRDGTHLTGGKIGDRLLSEAETNLAINVLPGQLSESFEVQGRGELQLGILIENMRREGFELSVSPPRVMYKTEKGQKLEPIEEVTIEVNDEHVGLVMEALSHRRAEVTDMGPVQGTSGRTRMSLSTHPSLLGEANAPTRHRPPPSRQPDDRGFRGHWDLRLGMMDNKELEDRLRDVGNRLTSPPSAVDELLPLLDHAEILLSRVEQSPKQSMSNALKPSMRALVDKELLGHSELDVKVAVTSCLSEITRITAPETPYDDDLMKEIFQRIVQAFENLDDMSSRSFPKRVSVLETVAKVRSCVLMLDLECDSLILEMFCHFLKTLRPNHSEKIFSSMEMIMTLVLEESEDISSELLLCLINSVKSDNKDISPVVHRLGEKVISNCSGKLKPYLSELSQSGGIILSEYSKVVASICLQNVDNLEQNINASGEIMADDSKQSERTVSDELLKGSEEMEQELGCPEEVSSTKKSPKPASSNCNVQMGKSESTIEPSSPKQMSEPSRLSPPSDQSDRVILSDKDALDNGDVKVTLPIEKQSTDATRRKRGRPRSKVMGKKHQGSEMNEQSAPSLQKKGSETGDKDITPQKELDGINNPVDIPVVSEDKSQRQRSRKGSVSKTGHGSSSKKSRISKAKQHEDLKGKEIVDMEPIKKEAISESNVKMPNMGGNIQGSAKTKSKRKLDHVGKEEFISESDSKMPNHEDSIQESAKTKSKRKLDHAAKESTESPISNKVLDGSIVGSRIRVWWPIDKKFYDGVIDSYDKASKKHKIMYRDGDVEVLLLKKERWELIEAGSKSSLEQGKEGQNSPDPAEVPKSKRVKVGSSSVPHTASTKPSTESGATSTGRRKGRPPKARPLNLDSSPSSSAKGNEQEFDKPPDENSESATKLKDDSMAKDDISKSKPTPKIGRGRKVNSRRKSMVDDTPVPASGSKPEDDDCASDSTKVKNDALKSKSMDSPKAVQTSKGIKTGRETKANTNSEEKPKVPESETSEKALIDTKAKSPESEAFQGKKRRRKRQT